MFKVFLGRFGIRCLTGAHGDDDAEDAILSSLQDSLNF
jgi:hypothetical protein